MVISLCQQLAIIITVITHMHVRTHSQSCTRLTAHARRKMLISVTGVKDTDHLSVFECNTAPRAHSQVHINTYGCVISSACGLSLEPIRVKLSRSECKACCLGSHKSPRPTGLYPVANKEIKGANAFPTLHFSWGWQTSAGGGAHFWKSVSEDVSIIHWVADLCGFIWCILKTSGGTWKRKMVYVTAINWGPLLPFLSEYTNSCS